MARMNSILVGAIVLVVCSVNGAEPVARAQTDDLGQCLSAKASVAKSLLACGADLMSVTAELQTCRTNPCVQLSTGETCGGGLHHLTAQQGLELLLARGASLTLEETARLTDLSAELFVQKAPSATPEQLSALNGRLRASKDRLSRAAAAIQRVEAENR